MTISPTVHNQLFTTSPTGERQVIQLPLPSPSPTTGSEFESLINSRTVGSRWTRDEHTRFLRGLEMFPHGPWNRIAALVGTRTTRQTMTHGQRYRERIARRASERQATLMELHDQVSRARSAPILMIHAAPPYGLGMSVTGGFVGPALEVTLGPAMSSRDGRDLCGNDLLDDMDLEILMSLLWEETDESHGDCESQTASNENNGG